jgi:hypothetical protein
MHWRAMSDPRADFFDRPEVQLREAAERPPSSMRGWRGVLRRGGAALAAAAAVALAAVVALVVLGGSSKEPLRQGRAEPAPAPAGTVIRKGEGTPPRDVDHTVVATGTAPVAGPWQMETYGSTRLADPETGEVYQPGGLRCLGILLLDPPGGMPFQMSGACGEFPRTPGFGRQQDSVPAEGRRPDGTRIRVEEVLVYGRVPERAAKVVVTSPGRPTVEVRPREGPPSARGNFYLIAIEPGVGRARINWIDRRGRVGGRGIAMMPPVTGR